MDTREGMQTLFNRLWWWYIFICWIFSYKLNIGIIVCAKCDNERQCFSKFKNVLVEEFHLSYPVIFDFDGRKYMMPEANESNQLLLYECEQFPYKWKK